MKYRNLGKSGLRVSPICLGTMTFGVQVNEDIASSIIKSALESGVNFFDTADVYSQGQSEEILGKALKGFRQSTVLATKVGRRTGIVGADLSRKHLLNAVDESLRRLSTDYIDLYYVHYPDSTTPIEETLRALDDLIRQGKIRYAGCSNFRAWQICKALWVSEACSLNRFICVQPPYNLVTRDMEYELLPFCSSEGIGVSVYNPLAGGLLTGKHKPDKPPVEGTRFALGDTAPNLGAIGPIYSERYWSPANFDAVSRLSRIASERGVSLPRFALAWVLSHEVITSAICGATSVKQLQDNLGAVDVSLTAEEISACDSVWDQLRQPRFPYAHEY